MAQLVDETQGDARGLLAGPAQGRRCCDRRSPSTGATRRPRSPSCARGPWTRSSRSAGTTRRRWRSSSGRRSGCSRCCARARVPDGEFYKVAFDYERDVRPVIEEVKGRGKGASAAPRAAARAGASSAPTSTASRRCRARRATSACSASATDLYEPAFDRFPLDDRVASLGDLRTAGQDLAELRPALHHPRQPSTPRSTASATSTTPRASSRSPHLRGPSVRADPEPLPGALGGRVRPLRRLSQARACSTRCRAGRASGTWRGGTRSTS